MPLTDENRQILVDFFHSGTRIEYKKNEFIKRPGENLSGVYFIESGIVKAYDITKYGEENLLIIRKGGEVLGLTAAITGEARRILYTTLMPTTLWQVDQAVFLEFIRSHPKAALPVLGMVTEMYRIHSERILNLEYRTVRERLVFFLISVAHRFGTETPEGILLDVPLRHQDIASSISATRETTGRELSVLEKRGLLSNKNLCITLHDIETLKQFL